MARRESLDAAEARLVAAVDARADELVELLRALVRAPSINPPGDTRAAAAVAAAYLERSGAAPRVKGESVERPSVLAEIGHGEPRLVFLSHLDTVPLGSAAAWSVEPLGGAVQDGRVWGRGAADAKGSAAAMLVALRVLGDIAPGLRGRATVALVADEETGGAGARHLLDQGELTADAVVVGETTDNQVAIAEKGAAWLRLSTRGRTAHASVPDAGVNAAVHLVRWLARLDRELVPRLRVRRHALVSPPSLSLGTLSAGIAPNVVPDEAHAIVDRRTLPGETLEQAQAELLAEAAALRAEDATLQASVDVSVWAEPFETAADAGIVQAALGARRALGLAAAPVGYQQASDGRFFGACGIPTVVLGPGVAEGTHVPDESVALDQLVEAAKIHALTAYRFLRAAGR